MVLLLTTTGRKSGKAHTVGLQYEMIDGKFWVGAADGTRADWYRNICALPVVALQAGKDKFKATAEWVDDPQRITDYLIYRLNKRPLMLHVILRLGGVTGRITRQKLLNYGQHIRVVVLTRVSKDE